MIQTTISVLPVVMKIFEAVVNQLRDFLVTNNILTVEQSGFRAKHLTYSTWLDVSDYISNNMSNGMVTGGIFLDLKKAFDTIHHCILLSKLRQLGIKGIDHKWLSNYLASRCQSVNINGVLSEPLTIDIGVPQASILGPLLFILSMTCQILLMTLAKLFYVLIILLCFYLFNDPDKLQTVLNSQLCKVGEWYGYRKRSLH